MAGWNCPTHAVRTVAALPKAAREYLAFVEQETGARVGMISTGPDREQTILVPEFITALGLRSD
jgi:adenylosuccinate synthase